MLVMDGDNVFDRVLVRLFVNDFIPASFIDVDWQAWKIASVTTYALI
jgi:hypothetical protein